MIIKNNEEKWIIFNGEDEYATICNSFNELMEEIKVLQEEQNLNKNDRIFKVVEEYKVEIKLKKIE